MFYTSLSVVVVVVVVVVAIVSTLFYIWYSDTVQGYITLYVHCSHCQSDQLDRIVVTTSFCIRPQICWRSFCRPSRRLDRGGR